MLLKHAPLTVIVERANTDVNIYIGKYEITSPEYRGKTTNATVYNT